MTIPCNACPLRLRAAVCRFVLSVAAVLAAAGGGRPAFAADQTWDNGSGDFSWNNPLNWGTAIPTIADFAAFTDVGFGPITLDANQSAAGLVFTNAVNNFSFINGTGTNTLTLGSGGIVASGGASITIVNGVVLAASQTWATNAGTLTVDGGINNGMNDLTISGAGSTTLNGVLGGGTGGLTKAGGGSLTLTAANTYTGATTIRAGTTTISGANGSIASSSSLTITGGKLTLDNASTANSDRIAGNLSIGSTGELELIGNGSTSSVLESIGTLSLAGGNAILTITGTGAGQQQTIAAAAFSRTAGATGLVRGTNLGTNTTNTTRVTIADLSGLSLVGASTSSTGNASGTSKTLRIVPYLIGSTSATSTGNAFLTYDTVSGLRPLATNETVTITDPGYQTVGDGENVLVNSAINLTESAVTVNSLRLSSPAVLGGNGNTVLTVASGAILNTTGSVSIGGSGGNLITNLVLGNGEGVIYQLGSNFTISAAISVTGAGSGGLTKAGSSTLILGNAGNSYAGPTTINAGTLSIATITDGGVNSRIGSSSSAASNLVLSGGTLTITGAGTQSTDRLFTLGVGNSAIVASSASNTFMTFTNTGAIAFVGDGPRTLLLTAGRGSFTFNPLIGDGSGGSTSLSLLSSATGANTSVLTLERVGHTYTGPTLLGPALGTGSATVVARTLANGGQPSSIGASSSAATNLVISNGRTLQVTNSGVTDRLFTINGTAAGHAFVIEATGLSFTNSGRLAYGAANQTRTLRLQGGSAVDPNSFSPLIEDNGTGATSIAIGSVGTTGAFWSLLNDNTYTGVTTITSDVSGSNASVLVVSKLANGGIASSVGMSSSSADNLVFLGNGTNSNPIGLRYIGTGDSTNRLFTLSSTFAGRSFSLDASGTGAINFTNTGPIVFAGTTDQARVLVLTGGNTGSNTLTPQLTNNGAGATSVSKTGTGTWVLAGGNNYTGATTVSEGRLNVTGTLGASAVSVASGARLGGTGIIGGTVDVASGGFLSPGASTSTLTINGTITMADNASLDVHASFLPALSNSTIEVGAGATFDFAPGTGQLIINVFSNGTDAANQTYTLTLVSTADANAVRLNGSPITGTGIANAVSTDSYTLEPFGFANGLASYSLYMSDNQNLVLQVTTVVPEPSHLLGVAVFALLAVWMVRRRMRWSIAI